MTATAESMSINVIVVDERTSEARHLDFLAEMHAQGIDPCPDCYTPRANSVCNPCRMQDILNTDPDYAAMADAQARLDFEDFVSFEVSRADEQTVEAFWRKAEKAERDAVTEPNACGNCRRPERDHLHRHWHAHAYVQPSNAQRLARMYARRAARLGLPVWSRPGKPAGVSA
jgi:hypothetical protein